MAGTRIHILLSILLPIALIAPYAYHLILVQRSSLPREEIGAFDVQISTNELKQWIESSYGISIFQLNSNQEFSTLTSVHRMTIDEKDALTLKSIPKDQLDQRINEYFVKKQVNGIGIVLLCNEMKESTLIFGQYRHGWSNGCILSMTQQTILMDTLFPSIEIMEKPALKYRISVSVLNEHLDESFDHVWKQELNSALAYIEPFADAVSKTLADVTIETQLSHYAKLAKNYRVDPKTKSPYVTTDDLQHFKAANDFSTASVLADREQVIHLTAAIPASPSLSIQSTDMTSFLIPGYGGVSILRTPADIPHIMRIFVSHCRLLFGLGSPPLDTGDVHFLPASRTGITQWELDILTRKWLLRHWKKSVHTLHSISSLVDEMTQMTVLPRIQMQVTDALELLQKNHTRNDPTAHRNKLKDIRAALFLLEDAYYNPTMVSQLYFPEDQIFIVYLPLLLPLVIPLLGGLVREMKRYREKSVKKKIE